ncbi:MAG TPA: hypothetical protein PLS49_02130 [Candidatus Woesebacteria bacterium]|nr:hypothetical protein [Candidatus Woesebacteria bacterium]
MNTSIFVNVPVKDLNKSMEFFKKLGWSFNPQFTDENAASMVVSDTIYVMLLKEDYFKTFTKKQIVDAKISTEALFALSFESKTKVDELFHKAIEAGATEARKTSDMGFMYTRSFDDLDGHTWELFWMDPKNVQPTE